MVLVMCIESPPGGGKGFLLKHLGQHGIRMSIPMNVVLQDDAIDHVMDYVKDEKRWLLTKELHFLWMHTRGIVDAMNLGTDGVILVEGSPVSDYLCHFRQCEKTDLEDKLYREWYEILRAYWKVDIHILLTASPHSHLERIIGNSKKEQSHTSIFGLYVMNNLYHRAFGGSAEVIVSYPNFEDNEPAMEIMRRELQDVIFRLKDNSLHRTRPTILCPL